MTKLEQLAALAARVEPLRVYATQDPSVSTEVARVVKDSDADVLAGAYNALPALVEAARVLARIDARRQAGRHTTLVADRKAMATALAALS